MFELNKYIDNLFILLKGTFGERLLYMGLQGSHLRNEADENSDIDIMVIIDNLSTNDLESYKKALISVGYFEKSCGFICGKSEIANWNPLEICHLLHTTKDLHGTLADFVPDYKPDDAIKFVKLSIGNIFHELCHSYIHSDRATNVAQLPLTYKGVFFILQNIYYLDSGIFIATKTELTSHIKDEDKAVMEMAIKLKGCKEYNFDDAFAVLFSWCKNALIRIGRK